MRTHTVSIIALLFIASFALIAINKRNLVLILSARHGGGDNNDSKKALQIKADDDFNRPQRIGEPIASLPKHVPTHQGQISLVADFEHKSVEPAPILVADPNGVPGKYVEVAGQLESVPLYVINRTGKPVEFEHEDSDLYVRLECQTASGNWGRPEPDNTGHSDCGNSYWPLLMLENDSFTTVLGYLPPKPIPEPKETLPVKVRYTFYGQKFRASSNQALEPLKKVHVARAETDLLAKINDEFDFASKTALGEARISDGSVSLQYLRQVAIFQLSLGKFGRNQSEAVLKKISESGKKPYAEQAKSGLERLNNKQN